MTRWLCLASETVAWTVLVLMTVAGVAVARQANATPEGRCSEPAGSPPAGHGTPIAAAQTPSGPATPQGGDQIAGVTDHASLIQALEACGLMVEVVGPVEQPFLQPESGTILRVSGEPLTQPVDLQVFEYGDPEQAVADAAQIGPDGNPPTMMISWLAPPHFFQAGSLIVLYLGEDQPALDLLTSLLGPPFAGQ
jgi:hypothetical protein